MQPQDRVPGPMPFFTFYGGKWRIAPKYPPPAFDRIMEPFCGSAGYSIRHHSRDVWINDADPIIAGTWGYLVNASERDILSLPDIQPGQTVDDLRVPQEAQHLIGWWLNKGSAQPKRRASKFMLSYPEGGPYWGLAVRERIASQLPLIQHWTVTNYDYEDMPNYEATWFIDPPYESAGRHYRLGSQDLDYARLGRWCSSRIGQTIVCEADDASWLPFTDLAVIDGTEGKQKIKRAHREVVWMQINEEKARIERATLEFQAALAPYWESRTYPPHP